MARPTKYDEKICERVRFLCERFGATDEDLATALGVTVGTLANWRKEHPEFLLAMEDGKRAYDDGIVQNSLLLLCRPRWVVTEKWDKDRKNDDGTTGAIVRLWAYRDPDPRAIALWMHNRQGWIWPQGKGPDGRGLPPSPVPVLGAEKPPAAGDQELVDLDAEAKDRLRRLAVDVLESRYGTTIRHVESEEVKGQTDATDQAT